MSDSDFADIEFPRRIALGAMREPGWSTTLVENFGGFENANQNWANAKHSYDIGLAIRTETDYQLVLTHFHSVRGRWKKFPFKDFLDYRCEQSQGILIDNGDSPAGDFQLVKVYGTGDEAWHRWITRPMAGAVIYRTRAGSTTVASATVSLTTGRVVPSGHVAGDTYAWSGQFFVPVRYGSDKLPSIVPDRQPDSGELLVKCDSIMLIEARESTGDGNP